jgi:hypothetical protein
MHVKTTLFASLSSNPPTTLARALQRVGLAQKRFVTVLLRRLVTETWKKPHILVMRVLASKETVTHAFFGNRLAWQSYFY